MAEKSPGYIELKGKFYHFDRAICSLENGHLHIEASGDLCELAMIGVPLNALSYDELPGKTWAPDWDDMGTHADVFAEGVVEVRGRQFLVNEVKVECRNYHPEKKTVSVVVEMEAEEEESGFTGQVSCYLKCAIEDF